MFYIWEEGRTFSEAACNFMDFFLHCGIVTSVPVFSFTSPKFTPQSKPRLYLTPTPESAGGEEGLLEMDVEAAAAPPEYWL